MDDTHLAQADTTRTIIRGLYDVYNELGFGFREVQYQRALTQRFVELGLQVAREQHHAIEYHGRVVGRYYIDFLINEKVVLELKVGNEIFPSHIRQIVGYLKVSNLHVGLIAIYTPDGVTLKRVVV